MKRLSCAEGNYGANDKRWRGGAVVSVAGAIAPNSEKAFY